VRVVLVTQTPAQLREVYGIHNAETMMKSLVARIVFAPKDFADAREISDELGFTTVRARTVSHPIGPTFDRRGARSRSVSISEQRRALLLPQEVKELGNEEAIVFYEGLRPIRCRKIRYFVDRRFRSRVLPPPATPIPQGVSAAGQSSVTEKPAPAPESPEVSASPPARTATGEVMTREATAADVEGIEALTLENIALDPDKLRLPEREGRLSDGEMTVAVESFLESLRGP
jgi:type IV secretion system protein VirD4